MDRKITTGLRWGELLIGLGFAGINVGINFGIALLGGRAEGSFYFGFWLAWMSFAAFVGMTVVLIPIVRELRILRHVFVSVVILSGIGFCLVDQHFFASPGVKNWMFNGLAIVGLVVCVRANRHFAPHVRLFAVPVTVITLCVSLFWALASPCQIFLPVLFIPNADLSAAHATFSQAFVSGVFASILICAVLAFLGARRTPAPERSSFFETPIPGRTKIRMLLGVIVFIAIAVPTLYFIPGTCSASGGIPVEFLKKNRADENRLSAEEIDRYLREIGLEPSDGDGFLLRQQGSPVAWYRYPMSKSRGIEFCLWRDSERDGALFFSYRYSKLSGFESGKANTLNSTIRRHFQEMRSKVLRMSSEAT